MGLILFGIGVAVTLGGCAALRPSASSPVIAATFCNQAVVNFDADGDGTNEAQLVTDNPATLAFPDPTCVRTVPPGVGSLGSAGQRPR